MALLNNKQYLNILFTANEFKDIQDIADHFLAEYNTNKTDNPRFIKKLNELIQETKQKIDELRIKKIAQDEKGEYKNPDLSPIPKRDYLGYNFSGDKLGFGLIQYSGGSRLSMNKINDIEKAFEVFERNVIEDGNRLRKNSRDTKLDWKGSKVQLYSVLRQLKTQYELIANSYNELADFLIQNVKGFESTSKETVEKELKKKQQPQKNKRVNFTNLE